LHAADDLLVERGFGGVTVEGIAARAGVAKQTIYRNRDDGRPSNTTRGARRLQSSPPLLAAVAGAAVVKRCTRSRCRCGQKVYPLPVLTLSGILIAVV
jgi:hypothetical protein